MYYSKTCDKTLLTIFILDKTAIRDDTLDVENVQESISALVVRSIRIKEK